MLGADREQQRMLGVPFGGRWFSPPFEPAFAVLARRYLNAGFPLDARRCSRAEIAWHAASPGKEGKQRVAALSEALANQLSSQADVKIKKKQWSEAQDLLEEVVAVKPDDAPAHNDLGAIYASQGELENAAQHYRKALDLNPENRQALSNLGFVLAAQGKSRDAVDYFRKALDFEPNWPIVEHQLAWTLATTPDDKVRNGIEAVSIAQKLCENSHFRNARYIDALAAAFAERGEFERAITTAQQAIELATLNHDITLANEIQERRRLYERHAPYRDVSQESRMAAPR
jgi:Flp pilus assembly protein TadD